MSQEMTFDLWCAEVARLDNALDGPRTTGAEVAAQNYWRKEYDMGKTPRRAVIDNYDGALTGKMLDEALARNIGRT